MKPEKCLLFRLFSLYKQDVLGSNPPLFKIENQALDKAINPQEFRKKSPRPPRLSGCS